MYTTIIADDEILISDTIASVIHTAVPELDVCGVFSDGDDVYDYLASNPTNILLLDIEMPGKTGLDIAQFVRDQQHNSYLIIITAYQDFNYAKRAIECNVNAFLIKPFTSKQLIDALQKAIHHFESIRLQAFQREMDTFFQLLSDEGANLAKKQLSRNLQNYCDHDISAFAKYMEQTYQIAVDCKNAASIINSIDALINRSLTAQTGNMTVDLACEFIHNHYSNSAISLEVAAAALHVSTSYLSRVFKKHMNQNFSNYLLNYRMEQAKQLLSTADSPISEIAAAVGYSNSAYFRSSFKSCVGMTPKQFRQQKSRRVGDSK